MRSRQRLLLATSFLAFALGARSAVAAEPAPASRPPSRPAQSSTQFTLRREEAGAPDVAVARDRARAGDCAGALRAFDAAIKVSVDPTLRRDRGLCHEKLGDAFPAIDDYRAYLVARPDAPDSDQIQDRLARLEASVDGARTAAPSRAGDGVHADASVSVGTQSNKASSSARARKNREENAGEPERFDDLVAQERVADAADASPLRFGKGFIVGPYLMLPRYFVGEGASKDFGYSLGATLRYAWSPTFTFVSELGFAGAGDSGQASSSGGPLFFVGVEARLPLDAWATNQLYFGAGPGFERYTVSGTKVASNVFSARGRFGYRHVFGPVVALELGVDGGPAYTKPEGFEGAVRGVIGGAFAFVVGF